MATYFLTLEQKMLMDKHNYYLNNLDKHIHECPICGYKNYTKQFGIDNNFHICTGPMA